MTQQARGRRWCFAEARAVNSVRHKNIVDVTDLFVVDGRPCIDVDVPGRWEAAVPLRSGDIVRFGSVPCSFVDARALHALLKRMSRSPRSAA